MDNLKFRAWIRKADGTCGKVSPMTIQQMLQQETALGLVSLGVTDLEQSTNIKDKNGEIIFDGDIVHLLTHDGYKRTGQVKVENGRVRIVSELDSYSFSRTGSESDTLEVVGNVHTDGDLVDS
ncbi:hypothetical protein [Lactobacillus phage Satyr]|uniref:YopX protein domain-containing protein n=1 Tax=Lactobacillus phage Satyr TaxID=2070201 RepID=A0A2K9V558_9CAUD|nr:hypothetical protein HOS71_gp030 [Lactobacillus phage Satyr]AUV57278.1 hypothetical protein [Lactobacillus phage Satyr]